MGNEQILGILGCLDLKIQFSFLCPTLISSLSHTLTLEFFSKLKSSSSNTFSEGRLEKEVSAGGFTAALLGSGRFLLTASCYIIMRNN